MTNLVAETITLWRTRDGTVLRICDMTDQHLSNAIKMLENRARNHDHNIDLGYQALAYTHGEMAEYAIESGIRSLEDEGGGTDSLKYDPQYKALKREQKRRKRNRPLPDDWGALLNQGEEV